MPQSKPDNKNLILPLFYLYFLAACSTQPLPLPRPLLAVEQKPTERIHYEASGPHYALATQGNTASVAAQKMFQLGGNIIDAAIAASFAISVERPQSTGLGGGGFMIFHEAKTGKIYAIDFRERAPLRAHANMFLNKKGEVIEDLSTSGIFSVGIPGLVAGLLEIHQKFGVLSRKTVLEPAIQLAENGFVVYPHLAKALTSEKSILKKYPSSAKIFLTSHLEPYKEGEILIQKDLAQTLRRISKEGASVFYKGYIAKAIVLESQHHKGILKLQDFSEYKVKWREALHGSFKGFDIVSMPPPSSGGTHLIEILNILEKDPLNEYGYGSADALHLEAAAMQQAFADRAAYMGDPDFAKDIPLKGLLSKSYAQDIRKNISLHSARKSDQITAGSPGKYESTETTNFSIMDAEGNAVVSTQTINGYMGSGVVVPGTGILLNNEMDDFSAKVGASNLFGAIGGERNSIAPQKTPLSSMTPTLVLKDGKPLLALGAPGGTRIISCVTQTILNYLEFKLPLYESIANLRLHHQWKPDQLDIETPGFSNEVLKKLEDKGYQIHVGNIPCRVNAVARENNILRSVADPRDIGSSLAE